MFGILKLRGISFVFLALLLSGFAQTGPAYAEAKLLTAEDIKKIAPKAPDAFVQAFLEAEDEFEAAGINTRMRMAHFMAQVMTETGGLRRIDENMNYSEKALLSVFSRKTVSRADAKRIARKPKLVANWVYGHRLGNRGRDTDDGWNYRGSGFIQLTGRDNFRRRGQEIGIPLEDNPELARQAKEGLTAAIAYWTSANINPAADRNDREQVRRLVNGPAKHGLSQAIGHFNKAWVAVFRDKDGEGFESGELDDIADNNDEIFNDILKENGFMSQEFGVNESGSDEERTDAIREFQNTWGINESGILDEETQDMLLDPRLWRHRALEEETGQDATGAYDTGAGSDSPTDVFDIDLDGVVELSLNLGGDDGDSINESAVVLSAEATPGTGRLAPHSNFTQTELRALSQAKAMYAPYEANESIGSSDFQPFSVIGKDDRIAVRDTREFPARAVVQILFKNSRDKENLCSGTLISADTVLTAAHCIHSGSKSGKAFKDFQFFPGRNKGTVFSRCTARSAMVLSGWITAETTMEARDYDLGAFKIDCNDDAEARGFVGVRALEDNEVGVKTTVQGYARDKTPPGQQWVSTDELRVLEDLKGFYHNDTFGGTSGGAVFETGKEGVLIGVHTNGLWKRGPEPWSNHNAFTRITPDILEKIQGWVAK